MKRAALALLAVACGGSPPPAAPEPAPPPPAPAPEPEAKPEPPPEPEAAKPACPAPEHEKHCLWLATAPPNPFRAKHVTRRLVKDGFSAEADGDRIIVRATDAELERLFETAPSHTREDDRCVAALADGARLAARYAGEVGDFVLDDPTCEL